MKKYFGLLLLTGLALAGCKLKPINARIWVTENESLTFPEDTLNLPKTGVCFSGGGTRAMSAAAGQMAGLKQLGLWESIGYVSAVSGGSWASTIFTYCDNSISDEQLLGQPISPTAITFDTLNYLPKTFMGYGITRNLIDRLLERIAIERATDGIIDPADKIWIDAIGANYLEPYGIYEALKPRYFTLNQKSQDAILKQNPEMKAKDFYLVHNAPGDVKRPFLIVNSSVIGPAKVLPLDTANTMSIFNYTPLYVGSANGMNVDYVSKNGKTGSHFVGGSFVESFGFGGDEPSPYDQGESWQQLPGFDKRFTLADATGTSSSAFAATVSVAGLLEQVGSKLLLGFTLDQMIPEEKYWTIDKDKLIKQEDYRYGDGGNLENYGLLTLLQRKVERIVVFVNSSSPINDCTNDAPNPEFYTDIDPDLPPLFGYKGGNMKPNQVNNAVFSKLDFDTLYVRLSRAKAAGQSVMTRMKMKTIQNDWWGIKGGQTVEILWVYNEQVENWQKQLPNDIQLEIGKGKAGKFANFPLYKTMFEDGLKLVEYTPEQMNLLYQLSAWNVNSNAQMFDFLKGK